MQAIEVYRSRFKPSAYLDQPYLMLGYNVCAAATDEEAVLLRSSALQSFVRLRTGNPGKLPPPVAGFEAQLGPAERHTIDQIGACSAVGSPSTVTARLREFIEATGTDELMVVSQIWSHEARRQSYQILAECAFNN